MNYQDHVGYFSQQRMNKYLQSVDNHQEMAVYMYSANINISKSFHPLISILEVSLRNAIDLNLSNYFGSNNWIIEQKGGFMIDPKLTYYDTYTRREESDNFFLDKVKSAENKLSFKKVPITHDNLVSELSLGFWVKMYDNKANKVLKGKPLMAFKAGTRLSTSEVYEILSQIRTFRNRIAHNEPIIFNSLGKKCATYPTSIYYKIKEALRWLGNDIRVWSEKFDKIPDEIKLLFV